jgi:hypothetical protein
MSTNDHIVLPIREGRITFMVSYFLKEGNLVETRSGDTLWVPDEGHRALTYLAIEQGVTSIEELEKMFRIAKATSQISIPPSSNPQAVKPCEVTVVPINWLRGGKPNQGLTVYNESEYILSVMERRRN